MSLIETNNRMVQYSLWSNCCNNCDFCLREERIPYTKKRMMQRLNHIKENVKNVDWVNEYSYGISLLGGEIYYITDNDLQKSLLELIDIIIEYVLKPSKNPNCRFSTVTNGIYEPTFLWQVMDKIVNAVGTQYLDVNFSYDLKYRFHTDKAREQCLSNINEFHKRYNYCVGVQMILTQNVINEWKAGRFEVNKWTEDNIKGNQLCFLYPHPIKTGIQLDDFFFNRKDFINFMTYLKSECPDNYSSFLQSVRNSARFKLTGMKETEEANEAPILSKDKSDKNKCGHSLLYKCYADCDNCMLCDLEMLDEEEYA